MDHKFNVGDRVVAVRHFEPPDGESIPPSPIGTPLLIEAYIPEASNYPYMCNDGIGYSPDELEAESKKSNS